MAKIYFVLILSF